MIPPCMKMLIFFTKPMFLQKKTNIPFFLLYSVAPKFSISTSSTSKTQTQIERIAKIINDHPFPDQPLQPTLLKQVPAPTISKTLVEAVLGRLFAAHSNGLKALEFFTYSIRNSRFPPTSDSFEKTIHILARMRYFDQAWDLMAEMRQKHPSVLTLKSMSIMLCKIAKFYSYEETLEAFSKMEKEIYVGKEFGVDEFNVLLRAFCTEREMKEARSVFQKMHSRFSPNTKTMNILLLGFKESGDITAMELFYHDMVRRGFKPDDHTYNIRIDSYCKKGCFSDALRLLEEMDRVDCLPTLETITTLIHGAGVARNNLKARQLFDEIPKRKLKVDVGAYNALISAFVRTRDIESAMGLMKEMEEKHIRQDNVTYHTMIVGMMKSKGFKGVCEIFDRMIENNFLPNTRIVVKLIKLFCENNRIDLGLNLWGYVVDKGYCPHNHALDLLVTGLCSRGRVGDAFQCSKQLLERGRSMSEPVYLMLERCLQQSNEGDKLEELKLRVKSLHSVLPPRKEGCKESLKT